MSLLRQKSPSLLGEFSREMNQLFSNPLGFSEGGSVSDINGSKWWPAVDIKEDEKQFTLLADVPGFGPEDIEIYLDEQHRLVLKGERHQYTKEEKEGYLRIERCEGNFYRTFELPHHIDEEKISAKIKNGSLELILPKCSKVNGGKKIPIQG